MRSGANTPSSRALVTFPNDLEIALDMVLEAPIGLVFDVLTRSEHLRETCAPFGESVLVCETDLRVGGEYHVVFVPEGGAECSFRGRVLELDPPARIVQTWRFDGWPDVEAIESVTLESLGKSTRLRHVLSFANEADRAHMRATDGLEANYENVARYLATLT